MLDAHRHFVDGVPNFAKLIFGVFNGGVKRKVVFCNAPNAVVQPPHRPGNLCTFLGKLTRNLSLNRYRYNTAHKRGGGEAPAVLDEIAQLVSDTDSVESELSRRELVSAIDAFLGGLSPGKRGVFVCRYWYFDSVSDIASRFGMTENHVSVTLSRLRVRLRKYLNERGFEL